MLLRSADATAWANVQTTSAAQATQTAGFATLWWNENSHMQFGDMFGFQIQLLYVLVSMFTAS